MGREALNKPLKFGDIEQINALREIQQEIREQEEESGPIKNGLLKKYRVMVTLEGTDTTELYGLNENDIKERVEKMIWDPGFFEITSIDIEEVR